VDGKHKVTSTEQHTNHELVKNKNIRERATVEAESRDIDTTDIRLVTLMKLAFLYVGFAVVLLHSILITQNIYIFKKVNKNVNHIFSFGNQKADAWLPVRQTPCKTQQPQFHLHRILEQGN